MCVNSDCTTLHLYIKKKNEEATSTLGNLVIVEIKVDGKKVIPK